jgi:hypothetical protein
VELAKGRRNGALPQWEVFGLGFGIKKPADFFSAGFDNFFGKFTSVMG